MKRDEYQSFIEWWCLNQEEYEALGRAEDGDPAPLSELIIERGFLATKEAREFVAARICGEKKRRGAKRTAKQQGKEIGVLGMIREIQEEMNCGEHTAREVFLDRHPDICQSDESLKTLIRRAKLTLKEAVGRVPPPVVREKRFSEPD